MSGRLAQSKEDVTFSKLGRVETGIWEYRMVPVGHKMIKGIHYLCFAPTFPFPTPSKTYQIPFGGSARGGTSFLDCLQLHARHSRSLYAIYKIASVSPVGVLCRGHPNRSPTTSCRYYRRVINHPLNDGFIPLQNQAQCAISLKISPVCAPGSTKCQ